MDKRTIMAVVLVAGIWIAYMNFFAPKLKPKKPAATTAPVTEQAKPQATESSVVSPAVSKVITGFTPATAEETVSVKTSLYQVVLSNRGAQISSIKYGEKAVELAGAEVLGGKGFLDFNILFSDTELISGNPLQSSLWATKKISETEIVFETAADVSGKTVMIQKRYVFDEKLPQFKLVYTFRNTNKEAFEFPNKTIIVSPADTLGPKMPLNTSTYDQLYSVYDLADSFKKGDRGGGWFSDETNTKKADGDVRWFGINSRYYTILMIPNNVKCTAVHWDSRKLGSFRIGGVIPVDAIQPGASVERSFRVAIAEKEKNILGSVDKSIIPAMDVNQWIEPLRNGIFWCLKTINRLFNNFGVAIVVLSFITKALFLPLTIKSTNSMKRMSELKPKMDELKVKYKDSPQKLQQATMELYKKNGVNPLSGCLPLIVQMPFFIALYSALSTSAPLSGAPFVLWIKDLSAPDTVLTLWGFHLNILPLVMTATTFIQQKMSTVDTGVGGSQQMIMKIMPIFFIFFFWTLPSGLTLYWIIQNLLQIGHQLYVNKVKKSTQQAEA
jgi:YidC/Oxa1 family membrane protein insertase